MVDQIITVIRTVHAIDYNAIDHNDFEMVVSEGLNVGFILYSYNRTLTPDETEDLRQLVERITYDEENEEVCESLYDKVELSINAFMSNLGFRRIDPFDESKDVSVYYSYQ